MEGAGASVKFGLAGLVAGASTAWATDRVYVYLSPYVNTGGRGAVTQQAMNAVVAGALASVMIFAGDKALESLIDMGGDPLFRTTYYQAAFIGSSTARSAVSNVQAVWSTLMAPSTSQGPAPYVAPPKGGYGGPGATGPVMQQPPTPPSVPTQRNRAVPNCASGSACGSIML